MERKNKYSQTSNNASLGGACGGNESDSDEIEEEPTYLFPNFGSCDLTFEEDFDLFCFNHDEGATSNPLQKSGLIGRNDPMMGGHNSEVWDDTLECPSTMLDATAVLRESYLSLERLSLKNPREVPHPSARESSSTLQSTSATTSSATLQSTSATMQSKFAMLQSTSATLQSTSATLQHTSATLQHTSATIQSTSATLQPTSAALPSTSATVSERLKVTCAWPDCGQMTTCQRTMNLHLATHSSGHAFQCPICNCSYNNKINLTNHIKRAHPESKILKHWRSHRIYRCRECSRTYLHKKNLDRHVKIAHTP